MHTLSGGMGQWRCEVPPCGARRAGRGVNALVGGAEAESVSKIERLLDAGARVHVVAPGAVDSRVAALAEAGRIDLAKRDLDDADVERARIVFVAPAHEAIGARLAG